MTGCSQVNSLLDRYLDGRLEPSRAGEVAAHLASCRKCAERLARARRLASMLVSLPAIAAPAGFRQRVMDEVYRQGLAGEHSPGRAGGREAQRGRFYRRLGLSFVLSAAVLAASLVIPRASYPTIFASRVVAADLSAGPASTVKMTLIGADRVVRETLMKADGP